MTPQEAAIRLREWYQAFKNFGKGNERTVHEFLEAANLIESLAAELEDMTARYKIADDCAKKKGEMNEKLYAELATVKAERDAAVADITRMVQEPYDPCYCDYCKLTEEECAKSNCRGRSAFVWRGLQKEDTP